MSTALAELQDYTFTSKYARWLPEEKRRETWKEAVNRVRKMMLDTYVSGDSQVDDSLLEDINFAYDMSIKKKVLGSQRALQFGGQQALDKNARIYNCVSSYCDRPRFFQECLWLLLCGCGAGFSVQKHHVGKLPKLISEVEQGKKRKSTFVIPDTIEGWADALGALVNSYFAADSRIPVSANEIDIEFDYSLIRAKGTPVSGGVGKAPGPDGLRNALEKIRFLLDRCVANGQSKLRPIDAYDIVMHAADAVLSGGVRRSATICIFSPDDLEMATAKTGNWFIDNPQRGRSNNSALLLRNGTTFEDFQALMESVREFGEPGFVWADSPEFLVNPCLTKDTVVVTADGLNIIENMVGEPISPENVYDQKLLVDGKSYPATKFYKTGRKEIYQVEFASGRILKGTGNHKVCVNRSDDQLRQLGSMVDIVGINEWKAIDELQIGDRVGVHNHASRHMDAEVSKNEDYQHGYALGLFIGEKARSTPLSNRDTRLVLDDICGNWTYIFGLLTGLRKMSVLPQEDQCIFSLMQYSLDELRLIQQVLHAFGTWSEILECGLCLNGDETVFADGVKSITILQEEDVYDCTVDDIHAFDANGIYVQNCAEIAFFTYHLKSHKKFNNWIEKNGHNAPVTGKPESVGLQSGWQGCNLTTVNCGTVKSEEDLYERVRAATIIGTLQAGFTKFDYLGEVSEKIWERESLLGVSMTGMMENSDIVLTKRIQKKAAYIAKETNKLIAAKIGINQAARITCIKPEGTASCVLGTSSGIHPHHYNRYIRRVQANTDENVYKHFKKTNPTACERSVWSANNTDDVVSFPIEVPPGSKVKNQLPALDLLKIVKDTQQNWVEQGKNEELCVMPWLNHNVSNTITVEDDEWDAVTKYIYKHRGSFCGVSLLPLSGDKDYAQAPFAAAYNSRQIVAEYGEAALWTSGLIEAAFNVFDGDLWKACDAAISVTTEYEGILGSSISYLVQCIDATEDELIFYNRLWKYAKKYFDDDLRKLTYCMKDVYHWKTWCDLNRSFEKVDYTTMVEEEDNTTPEQ